MAMRAIMKFITIQLTCGGYLRKESPHIVLPLHCSNGNKFFECLYFFSNLIILLGTLPPRSTVGEDRKGRTKHKLAFENKEACTVIMHHPRMFCFWT